MSPYASQELLFDLSDKIADARNHLYSLEENDEEYDVKKMVLEHGLASLEAQFETEQREEQYRQHEKDVESAGDKEVDNIPIDNQRPRSGEATMRPANGFAAYAGSSHNALGGHFASDGVMAGQGRPAAAPSWGFDSLQETVKTPDTANFPSFDDHNESKSISSPDSGFLRPTKRQRESLGISNSSSHPAKSLRTTPSPAITGPTTPTSFDSCELPDDPDLFRLLGGDPHDDLREMREEQKLQQELLERLEAKRKQEREDFELAQSMEQEDQFVTPRQYPSAGPSTTPRGASQTILDAQGQYLQPDPHSSSPVAVREDPFSSYTLPVKQEYAQRNGTGQNTFKLENTFRNNNDAAAVNKGNFHQPKSHRIPTSEFIDLGSDDDFDIPSGANNSHPSSDPVEIDAGTFAGNIGDGQSDVINTGAYYPYGITTGSSNPINWGYTGGKFGQMLGDPVKNTFNSAYDAVGQQVSGYGRNLAGLGGTSVYSTNIVGSSSNFVDLDSYDQQPYDLTSDIFGRHGINPDDPANRALVESYTNRIDYVTHDPTRTAAEIKALLENIRPDEELPPENREGTPDAMTYALMEHQKLGLTWMRNMEEGSAKGGILADDMGLGKTIQALALMVARRSEDRSCKTTLIVAPVALLKQWEREIRQKLKPCPRHTLTTFILHGERRHITFERLRAYDAVLTTFGTLASELKRKGDVEMKKRANPDWRPTAKEVNLPLLGEGCTWFRVIIDEAQCIKNKSTRQAQAAFQLQAQTRWCMTGTPMMNSVNELYSLIHFLRIKPYCDPEKFRRDFTGPLKGSSEGLKTKAMRQLQALLKAILLRRTKKSQIDGKPILDLPERTTEARHAPFSEDESEFYRALETRTQLTFNKFLKAGTVGRNYSNILVLLLRLRQACCHPHLIKDFGQASGAPDITPEDMLELAKDLAPEVVVRIRELCALSDDKALECPVCMDMADNATIFIPCGHNTCSECFARISDPAQAIADGNAAEGRNAQVKCPNCRGIIIPSRVIDHNAFKRVHMPELMSDGLLVEDVPANVETTDDSDSEDEDEDEDDDDEAKVDSKGDLRNFIVRDDEIIEDGTGSEDDDLYRPEHSKSMGESTSRKPKKLDKGKGKAKETKSPKKTLAQLKKEGMRNANARKRYMKRLKKDWIPSAKTDKTMEILRDIQERKDSKTNQCEKTIVFSQFTSLLDLLEVPIVAAGWGYRRYDGSMNSNARNDAVLDFTDKKDCSIMLVSLKAGNAGLNLVAASQVIILDPFWNPYIEEQAIDRAHRIGQQKAVMVHRILVPNTVEDRILALQEKKRELIEAALDEKAGQSIGRLGVRELGFLFDVPT